MLADEATLDDALRHSFGTEANDFSMCTVAARCNDAGSTCTDADDICRMIGLGALPGEGR